MKASDCSAVRRRLEAFHDGELSFPQRGDVAEHLRDCAGCSFEATELVRVGEFVREGAQASVAITPVVPDLASAVVGRLEAEHDRSISVRLGHMFEDMHLVWAGLSASAATVTCAALLFGMGISLPPERSDSLAGVLAALAAPGTDRNPVSIDQRMSLPRVTGEAAVPAMLEGGATEEDLVFALAAVVTQEGRVAHSQLLLSSRSDRAEVLRLMNAVREARFHPASLQGNPVAVNLVWLITHTTVRAKVHS
jgi:hypothetical protein